jgi:hypothetical protein
MAIPTNSPRVEETPEESPDRPTVTDRTEPPSRTQPSAAVEDVEAVEERRVVTKRAHTSPAAAFSLIAGVAAAYTALLVFLSPADLVLGAVALVLGLLGMRAAGQVGVTGRWLAALGTLLGLGAILLGTLTLTGTHTVLNDKGAVDRVQQQVDQWRNRVNDADLSDGITG